MAGDDHAGGIYGLLDLIEEHRAALRYDWRARFNMSLDVVPEVMDWSEALDLVRVLRSDPSSQIAAALEGWEYPFARGDWMLADLIDIQGGKAMGKKWKAYPRPIKSKQNKQWGSTGGRSRAEVVAILNARGHSLSA